MRPAGGARPRQHAGLTCVILLLTGRPCDPHELKDPQRLFSGKMSKQRIDVEL